jgi:L-ascorbate 6-phosphate lactonase
MKIRWIGQNGYQLKTANSEILIDPYLSDIVNRYEGRERLVPCAIDPKTIRVDAVVCTHNHIDHLDPDAAEEMPVDQRFITTGEGLETLKKMGKTNAEVITVGQTVQVGDFTITAVFADHPCEVFGVSAEAEGMKLYFSADSLYNEKLFEIGAYKPDISIICINGKLGNMDYHEAAITVQKIGAKVNIPHHYDMFASNSADPKGFADHIPGGRILEFNRVYTTENL